MMGLIAQIVLLAALAHTVGLGAPGWLAGALVGGVICAVLRRGMERSGAAGLGPADQVTLARAVLVGGVAALTAESFTGPVPVWPLVALTVVALVLDGVDGQVARRTGTTSALGARFDMEVDAFLILVLSAYLAPAVGTWVVALGLMRYAFVAASWVAPWLAGALPPRFWRKVVAATQGVVLVVAAAGVLPAAFTTAFLVVALALLVESFGRDVGWLWLRQPARSVPGSVQPRAVAVGAVR